jgi:Fe-S oxidoreductase
MAKLKAEWQQQYYDVHGVPIRSRLIAHFYKLNRLASRVPGVYNFFMSRPIVAPLFKRIMGFHPKRSIPLLGSRTLTQWFGNAPFNQDRFDRQVVLFSDEFTNFLDLSVGQAAIKLLNGLGYGVKLAGIHESGRTYLSKGLVRKAKLIAEQNIQELSAYIDSNTPLIGLEPSALLTIRDEYLELCDGSFKNQSLELAANSFLLEEFLMNEFDAGHINRDSFTDKPLEIKLHGHCHQKALGALVPTKKVLSLPRNYRVQLIPSGCCGMAGSFGYESEHYSVSMNIGELVLFPAVRKMGKMELICAPGTSCRHQIKDGTGHIAYHPAEILVNALKHHP